MVKRFRYIMLVLLILGLAGICFYLAIDEKIPYIKAEVFYKEIQEEYAAAPNPEAEDPINRNIDFDQLQAVNPEIVAWIYVPGTQIDYPICRGADINHYLYYNAANQYNILGAIFVSGNTAKNLSDAHTVIYGHNMVSGQMFGELSKYKSQEFRDSQPYIYIYTPGRSKRCMIYNAQTGNVEDINAQVNMQLQSEEYRVWIQSSVAPQAYIENNIKVIDTMQTFTLSTCTNDDSYRKRFVIHSIVDKVK